MVPREEFRRRPGHPGHLGDRRDRYSLRGRGNHRTTSEIPGPCDRDGPYCALSGRAADHRAFPFLGTGSAGGKSLRADLLQGYLWELHEIARETHAAIALSFFQNPNFPPASENGARAYAMAQAIRRKHASHYWPQDEWPDLLPRLRKFAAEGRLAVFVGAGVSRGAGLPGWKALLQGLRDCCEEENRREGRNDERELPPSWDQLSDLDPLLCGQVIQEWWPGESPAVRQSAMRKAIAKMVDGKRYGLQHALLAALPVQDFVTTNYDQLLELAATNQAAPLNVVPTDKTERWNNSQRRLLKLHGTVSSPEGVAPNLVLTAQDYLRFHETSGALGGAVQGLMLSHHLLFVGFSMTDPNFLRLHDSVARLLPQSTYPGSDSIGTALLVESEPWRIDFANRMLRGIHCTRPARSRPQGIDGEARWLEIFLDALVAECYTSVAYVSDNLFSGLLDERDVSLANALLQLSAEADTPLHEKFRTLLRETGLRKWGKPDSVMQNMKNRHRPQFHGDAAVSAGAGCPPPGAFPALEGCPANGPELAIRPPPPLTSTPTSKHDR